MQQYCCLFAEGDVLEAILTTQDQVLALKESLNPKVCTCGSGGVWVWAWVWAWVWVWVWVWVWEWEWVWE